MAEVEHVFYEMEHACEICSLKTVSGWYEYLDLIKKDVCKMTFKQEVVANVPTAG